MYRILEGGTDAASMVLFDPAALPDDFDVRQRQDPLEQIESLMHAGKLYWLQTCADGGHELGVYVDTPLPDQLTPYAKRLDTLDRFHVPSGRLFFTGIEYAFHADDADLRKHPSMGEATELAAGIYRAEFFEFDYPPEFHDGLLQQRLPAAQLRIHSLMNTLVPIGCISFLALLGVLYWSWKNGWASIAIPFLVILIVLPLIVSRLPAYRRANAVYKDIQKEFLGYAVVLQRDAAATR